MTNTNVTFRNVSFGMPVDGRVRVPSLCAPMTDRVAANHTWLAFDGAILGTGVVSADVATGAFPGTHAWSPPS